MKKLLCVSFYMVLLASGLPAQADKYVVWDFVPLIYKMPAAAGELDLVDLFWWAALESFKGGNISELLDDKRKQIANTIIRRIVRQVTDQDICTVYFGNEADNKSTRALYGYRFGDKQMNEGLPNVYIQAKIFTDKVVISREYIYKADSRTDTSLYDMTP